MKAFIIIKQPILTSFITRAYSHCFSFIHKHALSWSHRMILSYLDEGFKMSLLVVEQSIPMGDYQNDRYSTRRKILVVYDTKMTDI